MVKLRYIYFFFFYLKRLNFYTKKVENILLTSIMFPSNSTFLNDQHYFTQIPLLPKIFIVRFNRFLLPFFFSTLSRIVYLLGNCSTTLIAIICFLDKILIFIIYTCEGNQEIILYVEIKNRYIMRITFCTIFIHCNINNYFNFFLIIYFNNRTSCKNQLC